MPPLDVEMRPRRTFGSSPEGLLHGVDRARPFASAGNLGSAMIARPVIHRRRPEA